MTGGISRKVAGSSEPTSTRSWVTGRAEEKCAPAPALRTIYSQSSRDPNERDEL